MTLMSREIRVIMACDKDQLGSFDYVVTHIQSVAHGNMSKIRLEKNYFHADEPTYQPTEQPTDGQWTWWFILLSPTHHLLCIILHI